MKIEKDKTIAVVIDVQERLVPVMDKKEDFLANTKKLIQGLTELSVHVIATEQYPQGLGKTLPEISRLIDGFLPIEKTTFSCYDSPAFIDALEEVDAPNVILCGIESHVCLLQTAVDLKEEGYCPIVVADCTTSRYELDKLYAMDRFRYEGILISSCESILFELTRYSRSEHFKAISKIVK